MATGREAFGGTTTAVIFDGILHGQPVPPARVRPEVPAELERILDKALEKDRSLRYQSAAELKADLLRLRRASHSQVPSAPAAAAPRPRRALRASWLALAALLLGLGAIALAWWTRRAQPAGAPPAAGRGAVAVLPFHNLGADRALDYLELAIADEIASTLTRAPALAVRPFSRSAAYAEVGTDPRQAGRELRAERVVTGQLFPEGDRLNVMLEAIDVDSDRLLWRASLSVPAAEMITLRDQVAGEVRRGLLPALGAGGGAPAGQRPTDEEAYRLYLRSLAFSSDPDVNAEALGLLQAAVERDPGFAPLHVELARRYYNAGNYALGGLEDYRRAEAAARRALELDPGLVAAAGRLITLQTELGELPAAYDAARALVAQRPERSASHSALAYVLRYGGLLERSIAECEAAFAADPNDILLRSCSIPNYLTGRFERAVEFLRLDGESDFFLANTVALHLRAGRSEEAAAAAQRLRSDLFSNEYFQECLGNRAPAPRALASELESGTAAAIDPEQHYWTAGLLAHCGEPEAALRLLGSAIAGGYCSYPVMDHDPLLASARQLPGWAEVRAAGAACHEAVRGHVERAERDAPRAGP